MAKRIFILKYLKTGKRPKTGVYPIYFRLTQEGKRVEISTGLSARSEDWNVNRKVVKGKNSSFLNDSLQVMQHKLESIINKLRYAKKEANLDEIKNEFLGKNTKVLTCSDLLEEFENKYLKRNITIDTKKKFLRVINHLLTFLKSRNQNFSISVQNLNNDLIDDFSFYLSNELNHCNNTRVKYLKYLKQITDYGRRKGIIKADPFLGINMKTESVEVTVLNEGELASIENKKMPNLRLEEVKDIFLFECYTGLSYADIYELRVEHLEKDKYGNTWICKPRKKTKNFLDLFVLPQAIKILEKYQEHPCREVDKTLLPIKSNQKLNAYLKEIATICNISKKLTTHVGRKTFSTTILLESGVPFELVSHQLGHSNLRETQTYTKIHRSRIRQVYKNHIIGNVKSEKAK